MFFAVVTFARADDTAVSASAQTSVQASADARDVPVILPTNPFYFAKEFARGVRLFFTFGKVKKAEYQLEVADQKALEVKEVEKLNPENTTAISKALENYQSNVADLKVRIESIQATATDPNVSKLLDNLTDQAIRHAELFDNLKTNDSIKASVQEAESTVDATVTAAARLDTPEAAQARIQKVIEATITNPLINADVKTAVEQTIESRLEFPATTTTSIEKLVQPDGALQMEAASATTSATKLAN